LAWVVCAWLAIAIKLLASTIAIKEAQASADLHISSKICSQSVVRWHPTRQTSGYNNQMSLQEAPATHETSLNIVSLDSKNLFMRALPVR
jgi:hypothetical protein